jgi:hypothetical protein
LRERWIKREELVKRIKQREVDERIERCNEKDKVIDIAVGIERENVVSK